MTTRSKNRPEKSFRNVAPFLGCAALLFLFLAHGAGARATPQSASAAPNHPADKPAAAAAPAQQTAKAHKVITNDDIKAFHAHDSAESARGGIPATGDCDIDCAQIVREAMGFGDDREGEWQIRLATARQALGVDSQWRADYLELSRAEKQFCDFRYQMQAAALPTGNDWNEGVERARRQEYAENMGRVLSQGVSNAEAKMNRRINDVRALDPVRATMMDVLGSRVLNSCSDEE